MKSTAFFLSTVSLLACVFGQTARAADASHYVQPNISHADYGDLNIVMPLSVADPSVWQTRIHHAMNAVATANQWNGRAHVTVVVYGEAIEVFAHHNDEVSATLDKARGMGVSFKACNNSLKGFNLDWHTLNGVAEADIVPAGILEVPYLEQKGYFLDSE